MGGTYTSILGVLALIYTILNRSYYYRLAHQKYCVANYQNEEDRTSRYQEQVDLQTAVEKILNPNFKSCDSVHEPEGYRTLKDDWK